MSVQKDFFVILLIGMSVTNDKVVIHIKPAFARLIIDISISLSPNLVDGGGLVFG